jgi:hypothetical protein
MLNNSEIFQSLLFPKISVTVQGIRLISAEYTNNPGIQVYGDMQQINILPIFTTIEF